MGPVNFLWTTHGHKRNNARWKKKVLAVTDYWRYIILQYILCTTFLFVTVLSLHLKFVNITLSEPCSKLLKLMSEFFYFDLLQLVSFRIVYYLLCRMPLMKILAGSWGLQTILKSLISRTFVRFTQELPQIVTMFIHFCLVIQIDLMNSPPYWYRAFHQINQVAVILCVVT